MTYDHRNTGTREDLLRARSEGRSLMARRRVTIVHRFSPSYMLTDRKKAPEGDFIPATLTHYLRFITSFFREFLFFKYSSIM